MDVRQARGQTSSGQPVPISSYQDTRPVPDDNYQEKDDYWENGFNREATYRDGDSTPIKKDDKSGDRSFKNNNGVDSFAPEKTDPNQLPPIPPVSTGRGMPYAPVDWPNPGDVWGWRVGRRVSGVGFHQDRFVIPPPSLQKPNGNKSFASKQSLARYLETEFPNTDIAAFFDSFSWKIPALFQPAAKVDAASLFEETPKEPKETQEQAEKPENAEKDGKESSSRYSQRKRKPMQLYVMEQEETPTRTRKKEKPTATPAAAETPSGQRSRQSSRLATRKPVEYVDDLSYLDEDPEPVYTASKKKKKPLTDLEKKKPLTDLEKENVSIPHIYVSPVNGVLAVSHEPVEINPEEFDNYLNSLENLLMQEEGDVHVNGGSTRDYEYTEARIKISSFLVKDIPSLLFSEDIAELAQLAKKLKKDPRLSAEEMAKLKLIEETPSFGEVFRESKGVIEEADKFFSSLDLNRSKVASLKYEYSELKDKLSNLNKQVESNTQTIRQIDEKIAELQARRAELTRAIGNKNKEKIDLNYAQKMVANSIPKVVQEIQQANSKKPEWESRKDNALQHEADILAKFAPLKGFYL